MVCLKYKAFGSNYFCSHCYEEYKDDIKANTDWVKEIKKIFWRDQKRQKRINRTEIFLDDLHLVVGNDGKVYPSMDVIGNKKSNY